MQGRCHTRAIALFKMGIGCHGLGVLDKAVSIELSHGLTEDGKTVAPHLQKKAIALGALPHGLALSQLIDRDRDHNDDAQDHILNWIRQTQRSAPAGDDRHDQGAG